MKKVFSSVKTKDLNIGYAYVKYSSNISSGSRDNKTHLISCPNYHI